MIELTAQFSEAIRYAQNIHAKDLRKGTQIPYLSHLLQVAGLVLEFGGTEIEAIGGLLHDAAEDQGGEAALSEIRIKFGGEVESIVRQNSDSLAEDKDAKEPWIVRKQAYLAGIEHKTPSALLVSICDKIHNARSLNQDSRAFGEDHWKRFNASKAESLWYYQSLTAEFAKRVQDDLRLEQAVETLRLEVDQLAL